MEMDPEALWKGFITVVKGAVQGTVAPVPVAPSLITIARHHARNDSVVM